jgi:hypothetical protein
MDAMLLASYLLVLLLSSSSFVLSARQKKSMLQEIERLNQLKTIKPLDSYIMFWRPQKVGSSTMLSVLLSYGYRYNLYPRNRGHATNFCMKILSCAYDNPSTVLSSDERGYLTKYLHQYRQNTMESKIYQAVESLSYYMSVYHELCNQRHDIIHENLRCAFKARYPTSYNFTDTSYPVFEIFMVREPLSRLISSYYFWGEIAKMRKLSGKSRKGENSGDRVNRDGPLIRLGSLNHSRINVVLQQGNYVYHGNESSVPSIDLAIKYSKVFPLNRGMPGPSFTYSAFSDNPRDASTIVMASSRMMTMITERLDESLVALSHYLNWSLADVVITMHRKSLSTHPKAKDWPELSVDLMKRNLEESGEYDVYKKANEALDNRIVELTASGVNFADEVMLLRQLRARATEVR